MNKLQKIMTILKSLLMIVVGLITMLVPERSYVIVAIIIGVVITLAGIKNIIYYFTSAKHMVGGGKIIINGIILLDFGLLSFFILMRSYIIAMLYLIGILMVLGAIDIVRSLENKKNGNSLWILRFVKGLLCLGIGVICMIFIKDSELALFLFGVGWVISGIEGFISLFHKNAVLYVQ